MTSGGLQKTSVGNRQTSRELDDLRVSPAMTWRRSSVPACAWALDGRTLHVFKGWQGALRALGSGTELGSLGAGVRGVAGSGIIYGLRPVVKVWGFNE